MDKNKRTYIELNAFRGKLIRLTDNLPFVKMPSLDELGDGLYSYLYFFTTYINQYKTNKKDIYFSIIENDDSKLKFISFLNFITDCSELVLVKSTFQINDTCYINYENIHVFMDVMEVLHHMSKADDNEKKYTHSSSLVDNMLAEAEKRKQKIIEATQKNDDDNSGFLELVSTISARHSSLNVLNIGQLNYYQLIDQYKRLMMIDKYTPCLYGNATEEYIKENNVKHYGSKII